jgi:hypothetical protein
MTESFGFNTIPSGKDFLQQQAAAGRHITSKVFSGW